MGFPLAELELAIRQRQPVMLWGAPGVGKTARIYQLAEKLKLPVVVVLASIREPTDFGFPVVRDDGTLHLCPPSWVRDLQTWKNAILFLDELSTAPFAVQAPLLRIIHEKVVGEERLPEEVAIVAAAEMGLAARQEGVAVFQEDPEKAAGRWTALFRGSAEDVASPFVEHGVTNWTVVESKGGVAIVVCDQFRVVRKIADGISRIFQPLRSMIVPGRFELISAKTRSRCSAGS